SIVASHIGESHTWVETTRARLLSTAVPFGIDDFLNSTAAIPVRHLWLGSIENGYASVVVLRGITRSGVPSLASASSHLDGVTWVDRLDEISSVMARYRRYMGWMAGISYFILYALLYFRYHAATWRLLAPTAISSVLTLALLTVVGQGLQLFHVLAFMLLLGVGVDYAIFLHEQKRCVASALLAVSISAIGILLSFGLLALSRTPALQAFGLTMLIGIMTVWLLTPCFVSEENAHLTND